MRTTLLVGTVIAVLPVTNQVARAQGLFGVLENAAATPVVAVQDLVGATTKAAEQGAATAAHLGTEGVYLAGDGSETVYKYHPGARLGRKAGIMPEGKLGLLPSHDAAKPSPDAQSPDAVAGAPHPESGRATHRSSADGDRKTSQPTDSASSSGAVQPSDQHVSPSRRAPAGSRRARGLISRLFHFGRR